MQNLKFKVHNYDTWNKNLKLIKYFAELKREIAILRRAAASISSYSKDEEAVKDSLVKRSITLLEKLKITANNNTSATEEYYTTNLKDLENQVYIRTYHYFSCFLIFLSIDILYLTTCFSTLSKTKHS